jgi:mersacidin/lichenicidin family type 2 lantibiotic
MNIQLESLSVEKGATMDIVRAWKDEEYRLSLSDAELSSLPASPVGEIELTDADLEAVYGGNRNRGGNSHDCHNNSNICSGACVSFQCNSFFCSLAAFC